MSTNDINQEQELDEYGEPLPKSKSQVKREMSAAQDLGKDLVGLTASILKDVPIDDTLREAIMQARVMKHREGYRRQLQYIGKLMRSADIGAIEATIAKHQQKDAEQVHFLHLTEKWRDRLLADGDKALNTFMDDHQDADRQYLRQLLRAALKDKKENKPPSNARKLFKYLREIMGSEHP